MILSYFIYVSNYLCIFRLVKFGYITPEQRGDALAIESAKIQYEKDLGYPLTSG